MKAISMISIISIFFIIVLNSIIFLSHGFSNSEDLVYYTGTVCVYHQKTPNESMKKSCSKDFEIVELYVSKSNESVKLVVRPASKAEFKEIMRKILGSSLIIPPQDYNGSVEEYNQYLINQFFHNNTFFNNMYRKYLNMSRLLNVSVEYTLSAYNYVENYPEMGFFPLYSIKPVTKDFIKKVKPVYMGSPLHCMDSNCLVSTTVDDKLMLLFYLESEKTGGNLGFDLNTNLYFKKNYLVKGEDIILPVNKTSYVVLDVIEPTNGTLTFLGSVPDYKLQPDNNGILFLIMVLVVGLALGAVAWRKKKR